MIEALERDPFDVPGRIIPAGMIYQWCSKSQMGTPDIAYQRFLAAGWQPVLYDRHAAFFPEKYKAVDGSIQYGGQVLMERPREDSRQGREMEMDAACLMAGNGRQVAINVTASVRLSHSELGAARAIEISGSAYATRKILLIADGSDIAQIHGRDGALHFVVPEAPRIRRAKRAWLRWLFDLISTEE